MLRTISKKITLFSTLLGLLLTPALSYSNPESSIETQVMQAGLLNIMHELETSLAYWHTMEDTPFSYAIIRGPMGWISATSASEEIKTHIEVLASHQNQVATCLGAIALGQNSLQTVADHLNLQELTPEQLPHFQDNYVASIADHLKPHHLIRHWTKYAIGTACLIAAGAYAYTHQDKLTSWKNSSKEVIFNFWKKNIKEPVSNTYNILMNKKYSGLEDKRNNMRTELLKLIERKYPESSLPENLDVVNYIVATGDYNDVLKDCTEQFDSWGSRLYYEIHKKISEDKSLWGLKAYAITSTLPKPEKSQSLHLGEDAKILMLARDISIDELLEKTQLNVELFLILPTVAALYATKKGYDNLFHKKILSEPLQHRLMLVDKLLNTHNTGDMQLSVTGQGYLYYHVHALEQYSGRIPSNQQKAFRADLQELDNTTLNVNQKMRVIDQMYRQYAFLNPLAI